VIIHFLLLFKVTENIFFKVFLKKIQTNNLYNFFVALIIFFKKNNDFFVKIIF